MRTAMAANICKYERPRRCQQMDLFDSAKPETGSAPVWKELPEQARSALTELMAQLILDHAARAGIRLFGAAVSGPFRHCPQAAADPRACMARQSAEALRCPPSHCASSKGNSASSELCRVRNTSDR